MLKLTIIKSQTLQESAGCSFGFEYNFGIPLRIIFFRILGFLAAIIANRSSTMAVMSTEKIDMYLARINYSGPKTSSLENFKALCHCQATSVPEDTLDLFGGPGKFANLDTIYQNIVVSKRGGFCYEQNGLFGQLLSNLGYDVVMLEGSYYMDEKDQFSFPFNHMLLKVNAGLGSLGRLRWHCKNS